MTQLLALLALIAGLIIALDLNRRGQGGRLAGEGEEATPVPTPIAAPTADPAEGVYPWQVWWQLLTDAPPPSP